VTFDPSLDSPEGTWIENFELRRVLGRGGFGVTYLATEYARNVAEGSAHGKTFRDEVALKEFFPQGLAWRVADSRIVPARTGRRRPGLLPRVEGISSAKPCHRETRLTPTSSESCRSSRVTAPRTSHALFAGDLPAGPPAQTGTLSEAEIHTDRAAGARRARGSAQHRNYPSRREADNIMLRDGTDRPV
jgi:hypothetical protein